MYGDTDGSYIKECVVVGDNINYANTTDEYAFQNSILNFTNVLFNEGQCAYNNIIAYSDSDRYPVKFSDEISLSTIVYENDRTNDVQFSSISYTSVHGYDSVFSDINYSIINSDRSDISKIEYSSIVASGSTIHDIEKVTLVMSDSDMTDKGSFTKGHYSIHNSDIDISVENSILVTENSNLTNRNEDGYKISYTSMLLNNCNKRNIQLSL
jgi:hypothetical protein